VCDRNAPVDPRTEVEFPPTPSPEDAQIRLKPDLRIRAKGSPCPLFHGGEPGNQRMLD